MIIWTDGQTDRVKDVCYHILIRQNFHRQTNGSDWGLSFSQTDRWMRLRINIPTDRKTRLRISVPTNRHTSQLRMYVPTDRQIGKATDQLSNKNSRTSISVPTDIHIGNAMDQLSNKHAREVLAFPQMNIQTSWWFVFPQTDILARLFISITANMPEKVLAFPQTDIQAS